jgi:phosphoglycolate phosphatase
MAATSSSRSLLVFDLDGTLADTAGDLILTLNYILAGEGLSGLSLPQGRPMVGAGAKALIERGLAANGIIASDARLETMFNDYLAHYEAHICNETVLYPGVVKALDRFEKAGWSFAVCTNKIEHPSIKLLTELGIAHRFKTICGKNTFATSKPDGEALLQTILRAGGERQKSIMVGDTKTDIDTARNANIPVIAVDFGYADRPIEQFKPDRVIKHFDDLWDAVKALAN